MNIRSIMEVTNQAGASDLHNKAGTPPTIRVDGTLTQHLHEFTGFGLGEVLTRQELFQQIFRIGIHHELRGWSGGCRCLEFEEIVEQLISLRSQHTLRMKLHALDRQTGMAHAHDFAARGARRYLEYGRDVVALRSQ